jgi:adenine-specific DNA methylase
MSKKDDKVTVITDAELAAMYKASKMRNKWERLMKLAQDPAIPEPRREDMKSELWYSMKNKRELLPYIAISSVTAIIVIAFVWVISYLGYLQGLLIAHGIPF